MNKQKKIMIAIAITITLSSMISISTGNEITLPPEETITVDYRDYEYYNFNNPTEVNLTLITSDTDMNALTITKTDYYPSTNETKYKIESNEIPIPADFQPGIKTFIYQDTNTGQLYQIQIDLSEVIVPLSQLQKDYESLQENYSKLQETYNNTNQTKHQLQENITQIRNILSEEYNLTENELVNITEKLLNEYQEKNMTLNETLTNLIETQELLNEKNNVLQNKTSDYQALLTNYSKLINEYNQVNESLNETLTNLMNKSVKLSQLERFKEDIDYGISGFYYDGRYYRSQTSYEHEIQELKDDLGLLPSYIIMAVFITVLAVYYFSKNYYEKQQPTAQEMQEYGYSPKAQKYDNFIIRSIMEKADDIKQRFGKKKQVRPAPSTLNEPEEKTTQHEPEQKTENDSISDKIDVLIQNTNTYMEKNDERVGKIEDNVTSIRDAIDDLNNDTKSKTKKGK